MVAFQTSQGVVDVDIDGDGSFNLPTSAGGVLSLQFVGGAFTSGSYTPPVDYNERAPFLPQDFFTFTIADDGRTTLPTSGSVRDLPDERSIVPATVTLTVTETNDPPTFRVSPSLDILEDSFDQTVNNVITNILPGPVTALDETALQTVSFAIIESLSTVPAGLMAATPTIDSFGGVTFFPAPDQVGTAVYVIRGTDDDPSDPRSTDAVITVNVRPVNDAPRFDPNVAGSSAADNPDDAYAVARGTDSTGVITDATITYTLREDNTQALGVMQPYFIPLNRDPAVVGYNRVGLLDVFVAGPSNELDGTPGGRQDLELFSFPTLTNFGGQLSSVFSGGQLIGLNYVPPLNFNNQIGGFDEFTYTVRDDSTVGGETYSLTAGALVPDRLTTLNRVQFNLNPVNDRPEFLALTRSIEAPEDSERLSIPNFASNINAGPPNTAFDEVDITIGQDVSFSVTSLGFPQSQSSQFFSEYPTITPQGTLSFRPAADVFGDFKFRVALTDDGPGNATRGDLISSIPVTITISVQPINDPPVVKPNFDALQFSLLEDGTIDILVDGDALTPGLLDAFLPGPANEAADITPGGNQSISLTNPIPATTAEGGTLEAIRDAGGQLTRFRYRPRPNFTGMDSFIYTVTDDGITVDIGTGGTVRSEPRIASNTVGLEVLPVNDAPQFSGAGNVVSDEDQGLVTVFELGNQRASGSGKCQR